MAVMFGCSSFRAFFDANLYPLGCKDILIQVKDDRARVRSHVRTLSCENHAPMSAFILELLLVFVPVWLSTHEHAPPNETWSARQGPRLVMLAVAAALSLLVCYDVIASFLQDKLSFTEAARNSANLAAQWVLGLLCPPLYEADTDIASERRS
jgi:hypothetical protein